VTARPAATLAAALAAALAACGSEAPRQPDAPLPADANPAIDAAPAREIVMATQPLDTDDLVEGIMTGGPSDTALIHLEAPTATLDWNIHGHSGGGTQTVLEEVGKMTVDYVFTPSSTNDWFLLLRNGGQTNMEVQVTIRLYGNMTWRWQ
jgi:hypothetical protein